MTHDGSIWLEHPEYPGYRFSPEGNVLSLIGKVPRPMRFSAARNGYILGTFQKRGVKTRALVHRLIAQIYCPGYAPALQVNHINGVKADNRAENLEWVTPSENHIHARDVLGRRYARGEARSELRETQVQEIYKLRFEGRLTTADIVKRTGIPKSTIDGIISGTRWKHLYARWAHHRQRVRFSTKLSPDDVRAIRTEADPSKRNYGAVATKYGTSKPMVCLIYNRKIYGDIV